MTGVHGPFLGPKEFIALVVDMKAPSGASGTHERKLGLCDTILGSKVRCLEEGVLGNLRNLV